MFDISDFEFGNDDQPMPKAQNFYIPEAAECMACGQCVNHCPTYKLFQSSEETPRSRLRTLDKILNHNTLPDEAELQHLQNCLQCLSCESVCPSKVQYGSLYDTAQQKLKTLRKPSFWQAWFEAQTLAFFEHKGRRNFLSHALAVYQKSGLQRLFRKLPLPQDSRIRQTEALMPETAGKRLKPFYLAETEKRGSVALFTGCMGTLFDVQTALDSIEVLNALGFDVIVPTEQGCCGAAHQHTGHGEAAERLAHCNVGVFNALAVDAVVYTASACGLMLEGYENLEIADFDSDEVRFFKEGLFDVSEFVLQHWPENAALNPQYKQILLHEPCSQRNGLKNQQVVHDLLKKIPGLELKTLDGVSCCGAGGLNMLLNPEVSQAVRSPIMEQIAAIPVDELLSTNIGCALHLQAGLRSAGQSIKLRHPISLISEALRPVKQTKVKGYSFCN